MRNENSLMLQLDGQEYYIDFKAFDAFLEESVEFKGGNVTDNVLTTTTVKDDEETIVKTTSETYRSKEVSMVRYDLLMQCLEVVLHGDLDEEDSNTLANTPIRFKLAFNTLMEYGIINISE